MTESRKYYCERCDKYVDVWYKEDRRLRCTCCNEIIREFDGCCIYHQTECVRCEEDYELDGGAWG